LLLLLLLLLLLHLLVVVKSRRKRRSRRRGKRRRRWGRSKGGGSRWGRDQVDGTANSGVRRTTVDNNTATTCTTDTWATGTDNTTVAQLQRESRKQQGPGNETRKTCSRIFSPLFHRGAMLTSCQLGNL
jgi:hypothetical protein